jgi:hypothetical protein
MVFWVSVISLECQYGQTKNSTWSDHKWGHAIGNNWKAFVPVFYVGFSL